MSRKRQAIELAKLLAGLASPFALVASVGFLDPGAFGQIFRAALAMYGASQ